MQGTCLSPALSHLLRMPAALHCLPKKEGSLKSSQMNILLSEGFQFHTSPLLPYRAPVQACRANLPQERAAAAGRSLSWEQDGFGRC